MNKIFFFWRGLDSHQSGGILWSHKESSARALQRWFDTLASMVRIASSGDTHRPPRTPSDGSEFRFNAVSSSVIFGRSCPQFLRRRRARRDVSQGSFFSRAGFPPVLSPQLLQHSILPDTRVAAQRLRAR
jgi:hypothetical protein